MEHTHTGDTCCADTQQMWQRRHTQASVRGGRKQAVQYDGHREEEKQREEERERGQRVAMIVAVAQRIPRVSIIY